MASGDWYYARGNQQYGPVSAAELRALAEKGALGPDDLVWRAGMSDWVTARRVKGLFEGLGIPGTTPGGAKTAGPGSALAPGSGALAGQAPAPPAGPLSPASAAASAPAGMPAAIPPVAPVSTSRPVAAAPDAGYPGGPPEAAPPAGTAPSSPSGISARETPRRALVTFERSSVAFERSRLGQRPHPFDYLLDALGAAFSSRFTEGAGQLLGSLGHYGLYAAMLLVLVVHGIAAVQGKSLAIAGAGLAIVLAIAALQYASGRFSNALNRLDSASTGQMVSTAVPDSLALFALLVGLGLLITGSVVAVAVHSFQWVLSAVAGFVVCQYAAILALNAESLGITISRETTVGQEVIGLVTLLAKLGIRLGPAVITAGVLWGTVTLGYAAYLVLAGRSAGPRDIPALGTTALPFLLGPLGGLGDAGGSGNPQLDPLAELSKALGQGGQVLGGLKAIGPLAVAASAEKVLLCAAAYPLLAYAGFLAAYVLAETLRLVLRPQPHEDEHKAEDKSQQ